MGKAHSSEHAVARSFAYALYAELLWWDTFEPELGDPRPPLARWIIANAANSTRG